MFNAPFRFSAARCARFLQLVLIALTVLAITGCAASRSGRDAARRSEAHAAAMVLDDFHNAAAMADEDRYFSHFASDAVFLGTDASERWTLDEFRAFAAPYFQRDSAWVYRMLERHITVSTDRRFAWFDERLFNDRLGETRGSGVLSRRGSRWLIEQYNLTIPIPNDLANEVAATIREAK